MDLIYLDNAATTPIFPQVVEAMQETMILHFGNPSSIHAAGRAAKARVESARKYIAKRIRCITTRNYFYFWRNRRR